MFEIRNNEKIIRCHLEGLSASEIPVKISGYKCRNCNKVTEQKAYRTSAKRDLYARSPNGSRLKMTESGRSMIEMLGVLAIIGVLSVGGIAGYSKAMEKMKINKTIELVTTIAGNIRTLYMNQQNYEGLRGCFLKDIGVLPDGIYEVKNFYSVVDGKPCYTMRENIFNSQIDINWDFGGFYINLNLPKNVCINLMSYDWRNAGADLAIVRQGHDKYVTFPISVSDAVKLCTDEEEPEEWYNFNNINFFFDVDLKDEDLQEDLENCTIAAGGC